MYVLYNRTLRDRTKGAYITTLHAINSGIIKLSRHTKATTVYRGVSGGYLPRQFWEENEHRVRGGVEKGFMSTSTERAVALDYMHQQGQAAMMLFESTYAASRTPDLHCRIPLTRRAFEPLCGQSGWA